MKLLVVVPSYPHAGYLSAGVFNQKSARALKRLGHEVEVLAPRPYVPPGLRRLNERWRSYGAIVPVAYDDGFVVRRPACLQVPFFGGAFWADRGAYFCCAAAVKARHRRETYDAVLSFNLVGAGGLAWRLGRALAIPAAGWATGNDVRFPPRSSYGRAVCRALKRLDVVFYQSNELRAKAAELGALDSTNSDRHLVLPRGIERPAEISEARRRAFRHKLGIADDQVLVLYVGRVVKAKGVFELVQAIAALRDQRPETVCFLLGMKRGFDDAAELGRAIAQSADLARRVRVLPECPAAEVGLYLRAADIFAFPSHGEGLPNSLIEAMAAGVPAIAFAIPSIIEIDGGAAALELVPPLDSAALARAIGELAAAPERRRILAQRARQIALERYQVDRQMARAVEVLGLVIDASRARREGAGGDLRPARQHG